MSTPNSRVNPASPFPSFASLLAGELADLPARTLAPGECQTRNGDPCTICSAHRAEYLAELAAKRRALDRFWSHHGFPIAPEPITPAPRPRFYRTVSKRRVFRMNRGFRLGLIGVRDDSTARFPVTVEQCVIEPASHRKVYAAASAFISNDRHRDVAEALTYVIAKGDESQVIVILNVAAASPALRKGFTSLSRALTEAGSFVKGVHLFVDPERSTYYLSVRGSADGSRRGHGQQMKLFGRSLLEHGVGALRLRYGPFTFTQTNHGILEPFVEGSRRLLAPSKDSDFYDLYSGYGLFALSLASECRKVIGVEVSRESVVDAHENAERMGVKNCRFVREDITEESLPSIFETHGGPSLVLLDPPRNGPKPGVIEFLTGAGVNRAVHIYCAIDRLAEDTARWSDGGFVMQRALPFDMFPGTDELEMMVLYAPAK